MGKGDKKTRRGKITIGTYGVRRLRKKPSKSGPLKVKEEKPAGSATRRSIKEKTEVHEPKEASHSVGVGVSQPAKEAREPRETIESKTAKSPRKPAAEKESKVKNQKDETKVQKAEKEKKEEKESKPKPDKTS